MNRITIALVAFVLAILGSNNVLAQTSNQTAGITSLLEQKGISTAVSVLFESPQIVVLSGEFSPESSLGQAIETAKETGYSIDSVTVFTETSAAIYKTRYLTPIYTVFMSK